MLQSHARGADRDRTDFALQPMEQRLLLCGEELVSDAAGNMMDVLPVIVQQPSAARAVEDQSTPAADVPLAALPVLHSLSGAPAKLFLDFNGDVTASWGSYSPGVTRAFDEDGDPTTFNSTELSAIRRIWGRIAEAYSPFNLDVTTQDPGNLNDHQTLRVVFGGDGAWYGSMVGGIGYVGGFSGSLPNTVWVFTENLGSDPKLSGTAGAHEAGHGFSLQHQAVWSGGRLKEEYNPGNAQVAPIMGNSYNATRGLWWKGTTSIAPNNIQDDMAVLSGSINGFGYRSDDHADTAAGASSLLVSNNAFSGGGVIERTGDQDYFSFPTGGGLLTLTANPAAQGGMLDLKLDLRRADGTVVKSADTSAMGESVSAQVGAGTYYVVVASHGSYGDVGQYTIGGTIASAGAPQPPTRSRAFSAPSGFSAVVSGQKVRLSWKHDGAGVSGFRLQRSGDKRHWSNVRDVGASARKTTDWGLRKGRVYYYRIRAYSANGASPFSKVARVRVAGRSEAAGAVAFPVGVFSTTSLRPADLPAVAAILQS